MSKKRQPNKRIQKKKSTQEKRKKLQSRGLSPKQQKRTPKKEKEKTLKKIERSERAKSLRQEKREYLKKHNLYTENIINGKKYTASQLVNLSWDTLQALENNQKKRKANAEKRQRTQENKINYAIEKGLHLSEAEKLKNKTYKEIDDIIFAKYGDRNIYTAKIYLSVLWSDVTGLSQFGLALHEFYNETTEWMINKIHKIIENAIGNGSKGFNGVPIVIMHSDKNEIMSEINQAIFNGYNYKMVNESERILTSNTWTVRGFANMMLSVMTRTKPELIRKFYNDIETYCSKYLPEIHKQIF